MSFAIIAFVSLMHHVMRKFLMALVNILVNFYVKISIIFTAHGKLFINWYKSTFQKRMQVNYESLNWNRSDPKNCNGHCEREKFFCTEKLMIKLSHVHDRVQSQYLVFALQQFNFYDYLILQQRKKRWPVCGVALTKRIRSK